MNITKNKETYKDLINSIERDFNKEDFLNYLEINDFFNAPATAQGHDNEDGGLCNHSLIVYNVLKELSQKFAPNIPLDSIKIVALTHELNKLNYYEKYTKNEKHYNKNGLKADNGGRFDWVQVEKYKVKDFKDLNSKGPKGFESYFIVSSFMALSDEEIIALVNYLGPLDITNNSVLNVYNQHPLATLLYISDFLSSFIHIENE